MTNKESLSISFTNGDKIGKCSGCIAKWGSSWAEADQVIYMFARMDKGLEGVRESHCYYCSVRLIDKIKDTVEKSYSDDKNYHWLLVG